MGCDGDVIPNLFPLYTVKRVVQPNEPPSNDPLLFCPDTDGMRWKFTPCITPSSDSCTTGTFSFEGQFSSDSSSCFDDDSGQQACVQTKDGVSSLYVCVSGLTSDSGRLEFVYTPDGDESPIPFSVDYGESVF